jgi:hypothetical protein
LRSNILQLRISCLSIYTFGRQIGDCSSVETVAAIGGEVVKNLRIGKRSYAESGTLWLTRRALLIAGLSSLLTRQGWAGETKRFEIPVKDGEVAHADRTIRVKEGDAVEIVFNADRQLRLHLHGIDIETEVVPGAPAKMSFTANVAGRFPVALHGGHGHGALMYVEVHPR